MSLPEWEGGLSKPQIESRLLLVMTLDGLKLSHKVYEQPLILTKSDNQFTKILAFKMSDVLEKQPVPISILETVLKFFDRMVPLNFVDTKDVHAECQP